MKSNTKGDIYTSILVGDYKLTFVDDKFVLKNPKNNTILAEAAFDKIQKAVHTHKTSFDRYKERQQYRNYIESIKIK